MDYTKLTWKELLKRYEEPHWSPDFQKAKDEIWRRLTIWGLIIAGLVLLATIWGLATRN
jgi:type VI protein secretion system component VasF